MFTGGETFEGYHIDRLLGASSVADTLLAHTPGKAPVVIKVFKDAMFTQEAGLAYLRRPREAITEGKISNQSSLAFYHKVATADVPQVGQRAYLVRSYIAGIDLATWRETPRPWTASLALLRKICLALDHLHQAGLIHGGLCPQNILVAHDTVKLTDFGTGAPFLGTVLHQGPPAPDKRPFLPPWYSDLNALERPVTDIYALGALLYMLQQGRLPEGIPADASGPVQEALKGTYKDVAAFLQAIEAFEEEGEAPEEQEESTDEQEESPDDDSGGEGPVPAPRIVLHGDGLEPAAAELDYRLAQTRPCQGGDYSFVVHNLAEEGEEIVVRVSVTDGADWMQVEPTEVRIPPGPHVFRLRFGPVQTPGRRVGTIVLEIPLDEVGHQITRAIQVTLEFQQGWLAWLVERCLRALAWLKGHSISLSPRRLWQRSLAYVSNLLAPMLAALGGARRLSRKLVYAGGACVPALWFWLRVRPWRLAVSILLVTGLLMALVLGERLLTVWPRFAMEPVQTYSEDAEGRAQLATLHQQLAAMTRVKDEAEARMTRLSNELATTRQELAQTVEARNTARSQVKGLTDKLEATQKEFAMLTRAHADLEARLGRLRQLGALHQIKNTLLPEGQYAEALRALQDLSALYPEHEEIRRLLSQMEHELTLQADLILPPGGEKKRGDMVQMASGSGFQLRLTPSDECYVYIYYLDARNDLAQIFPPPATAQSANPLQSATTYHMPGGGKWFLLDQTTGQEHLYFVASRWPARDLEALFAQVSHASGQGEKEESRRRLLARLQERAQVNTVGVKGFVYKEYAFWHE